MRLADLARGGGEGVGVVAQLGCVPLERDEQVVDTPRAGERKKVQHRIRVDQHDLAVAPTLDQADGASVEELQQLLFERR